MKHRLFCRAGGLLLTLALAVSLAVPSWALPTFTVDIPANLELQENAEHTFTPAVTGLPAGVTPTFTWESTAPATVQSLGNGKVKALTEGTASIKVTAAAAGYENAEDTTIITVKPASGSNLTVRLDRTELTLTPNESRNLTATVLPSSLPGNNKRVTWSSSNDRIASVTQAGRVTAGTTLGTAVITATSTYDSTKKAECVVTVVEPEVTIRISPINAISVGEVAQLNVDFEPSNTTNKSLTWTSSVPGIVEVDDSNRIRGLLPGETVLTATTADGTSTATVAVTVAGIRLLDGAGNAVDGTTVEVHVGESKTLTIKTYGSILSTTSQWQSSAATIARVTGSGSTGYITGVEVGTSTVRVSLGDYSTGCEVKITLNTASTISGNAKAGNPFAFAQIRSQLNQVCKNMTKTDSSSGVNLSYITNLHVSPDEGVLYYRHVSASDTGAGVAATERYYYSDSSSGHRMIEDLTFVPKSDFSGTAEITYTGWGPSQESFSGSIHLAVEGLEDVTYTTTKDAPVDLQIYDFNLICHARTGRDLNYVTFELPSASQGTLYYNYNSQAVYAEKVSAGTQYTRSRTPALEEVTFVPAEGYSGTVQISYRGVDVNGVSYSGRLTIIVESKDGVETGGVRYIVDVGERVEFRAAHFNAACREATGEALDYVRFTLPDASQGRLYYDYRSSSNPGSQVSAGSYYYRSGSPALSNVSFVPASGAPARVTIDFTGCGTGGTTFNGKVYIDTEEGQGRTVRYTVRSGGAVTFQPAGFNEACQYATGGSLSHVRFQLPASGEGLLCYQYNSNRGTYDSRVSSTTNYYLTGNGNRIGNVTFLANQNYSGTVRFDYTGYGENGDRFTGTVEIQVTSGSPSTVNYVGVSGSPVRLTASSLRSACNAVLADGLSHIQFTSLPSASSGVLYANYTTSGSGLQVSAGTNYYNSGTPGIDQLSFVPQSGFQGAVSLSYTAFSTSGEQVSGQINITINRANTGSGSSGTSGSSYFSDMGSYGWAVSAVNYLRQQGVVSGMGSGQYGPGQNIRRGDFVIMLCKAFGINGGSGTGFADVPSDAYYAQAVSAARSRGIVSGDGVNFRPNGQLTRQDAMVMVQNAMTSVGWSLGNGASVDLSRFSDSGNISSYARNAVGNLVRLGVINGDGSRLRPQDPITRAEMAVILHYVMTM